MTRFHYLLLFCGFALSAGLAQDSEDDVETIDVDDMPLVAEPACFSARDARSFDAINDQFVYIEGRRNRNYLLTMFSICSGLRSAVDLGISSGGGRVCSNGGAEVVYRAFGRSETCPIRTVESVDDKTFARRLVESRSNRR
jgi:hypothetical protein